MKYRIGIDVCSTTAKMVVLDDENNLVWSHYERHNARVKELLGRYFSNVSVKINNVEVSVSVTGSVGMAVSEMLQAEFVQEVVAASAYARE